MRGFVFSLAMAGIVLGASHAHADTADLRKYCKSDIQRLCKGISPGEGRIIACLKKNQKSMSVGCAQALQQMKGKAN